MLKAGQRLRSTVDETEAIVVQPGKEPVEVWCGGHPMVELGAEAPSGAQAGVEPGHDEGTMIGKRYVYEEAGLELLCTKAGKGSLSAAGTLLTLKGAKPLPSSD